MENESTPSPRANGTRSISPVIPHPVVAAQDLSDTVVVNPHRARRGKRFGLGLLPYELRVKIICMAVDYRELSGPLLLVSREFHEVLAPYFWGENPNRWLDLGPAKAVERLRFFVDAILPRYGSFYKRLSFEVSRDVSANSDVKMLVAQAMAKLPNLDHLETDEGFAGIIATSSLLASITSLDFISEWESLSSGAVLIARCPNLKSLELTTLESRAEELPALVAAAASRTSLTRLWIGGSYTGEYLGDTLATRNWKCPLSSLFIHSTEDYPLPIFHTFISHFTSTLTELVIRLNQLWFLNDFDTLPPLHLPHLVTLLFDWADGEGDDNGHLPGTPATNVPRLFDDSPILDAQLFSHSGVDGDAPEIMVREFIDAHKTLRQLSTRWTPRDDNHVAVVEDLVKYAKGCGVTLVWKGEKDGVRAATL